MVVMTFGFPLPNNGDKYDLSADELVKLLQDAYKQGFQQGKDSMTITVSASQDIDEVNISTSEWR